MGNQAEEKAESGEAERKNRSTVEATEEAETGSRERKSRRPSSRRRNGRGRKEPEGKRKRPKAKAQGKHSWNSCGSEAGKGERKQTESRVQEPGRKA